MALTMNSQGQTGMGGPIDFAQKNGSNEKYASTGSYTDLVPYKQQAIIGSDDG